MPKQTPDTKNDILYMQTFGGFSLTYQGTVLTGDVRSRESQFIYLMQVILHEREQGVSRDQLEEILFGDREIEDIRHAMRSVIYNAKKRLQTCGLPDVDYIIQKDGVYYWTKEILVVEDAGEFERMCQEAESEEDAAVRMGRYLEACYHYRGEFLPAHAGVLWAAQEARRYRMLFEACVEEAVMLLRERKDFRQMKELGIYAAKISPLSDWETVTMEALVSMGRYEEAGKFYEDTAKWYDQEQGIQPCARMMELFRKLGEQRDHPYESLEDIQEELSEEEETRGGYLCSYPIFRGIYRMLERMVERTGQSAYLMLCLLVDEQGREIRDGQELEELNARLGEAICGAVRRSDTVSRYGRGQYLVLLANTTYENCSIIKERISSRFQGKRAEVRYYVNSLIDFS